MKLLKKIYIILFFIVLCSCSFENSGLLNIKYVDHCNYALNESYLIVDSTNYVQEISFLKRISNTYNQDFFQFRSLLLIGIETNNITMKYNVNSVTKKDYTLNIIITGTTSKNDKENIEETIPWVIIIELNNDVTNNVEKLVVFLNENDSGPRKIELHK